MYTHPLTIPHCFAAALHRSYWRRLAHSLLHVCMTTKACPAGRRRQPSLTCQSTLSVLQHGMHLPKATLLHIASKRRPEYVTCCIGHAAHGLHVHKQHHHRAARRNDTQRWAVASYALLQCTGTPCNAAHLHNCTPMHQQHHHCLPLQDSASSSSSCRGPFLTHSL
jgi:hypothetical protein